MQQVNQHVDDAFLQQNTPRPISPMLLGGMFFNHVFERPSRTILHPLFVVNLAALIATLVLRLPLFVLALPLGVIVGMLVLGGFRVGRRVWNNLRLLRHGLILRAHIRKLRPNRTLMGEIDGAVLDCAIVVAPRRTYIGSIWIADGNEALRLLHQGRLQVLCLPQAPGTWRVIEPVRSELSYERVGPMAYIPPDV